MRVYYDHDADLDLIKRRRVAIFGYGSQGHAHAANLKESGIKDLRVALRPGSARIERARGDGFEVLEPEAAAAWADLVMVLIPDELQAALYREVLAQALPLGASLLFAHGLNIHFNLIEPRSDLDVFMVAPKGPGHTVRSEYLRGAGVPCLIATAQDATGGAKELSLSYASAIGGGRAGIIETTFQEECETDLFGEQAVLCGGLHALLTAGYEILVEAGYSPEMAYFECLHEVKLIVDLLYEGGLSNVHYSISNTAEYGSYMAGSRIIDEHVRRNMRKLLEDIRSGRFTRDWVTECAAGQPSFKAMRRQKGSHELEVVGQRLRDMMPWIKERRLVKDS